MSALPRFADPVPHSRSLVAAALLTALGLPGCSAWLFSGVDLPDRSRPVVRIDTRGGIEHGVATEEGILFLGRTATSGPCRVHYFLGPDPAVTDGEVEAAGGVFCRARVDLAQQSVPLLERPLQPDDEIVGIYWTPEGTREFGATPLSSPESLGGIRAEGSLLVLDDPDVPAGAGLFVVPAETPDDRLHFVGLIAGAAEIESEGRRQRVWIHTGLDRLAELVRRPERDPAPTRVRFRPDGIWVREASGETAEVPASSR